ncbi:hypothetical protein SAXI111661_08480 [Saccharomonospora xinjiangensis]|nr:hypothetical protein EYD13_16550 [Saccharomonospora xinjiangensis]
MVWALADTDRGGPPSRLGPRQGRVSRKTLEVS